MKYIVYSVSLFVVTLIVLGMIFMNASSKRINTDRKPITINTTEADHSRSVDHFFINDEMITYKSVEIYEGYAAIPLIKFLSAFEYDVQWISENTAIISKNENEYELNLETMVFRNTTDNYNYFHAVYGTYKPIRKRQEKEVLIDTMTLISVTQLLGSRAEVSINDDDVLIIWDSSTR